MNAIIERLQFQLGAEILPDSRWGVFLDEVRAHAQTVELALRSLRENRDKLLAIIDLIPVAFFVKDNQSNFFLMNRACELQWGLSFADLRDNDGRQFFPPIKWFSFWPRIEPYSKIASRWSSRKKSGAPLITAIGSAIRSSDPCTMRMATQSISFA